MATGSVTTQVSEIGRAVARYVINWTSDASGAVSQPVTLTFGTFLGMAAMPGTGGSQPTNLYDVTLTCTAHDSDLLEDEGLNLSNSVKKHGGLFTSNSAKTAFHRQLCHGGDFTFAVANAGDTKSGTFELYIAYIGVSVA